MLATRRQGRHLSLSDSPYFWVVSRHPHPQSLNDCKCSAKQSIAINTQEYSGDGIIDRLSPGA